MDYLNTFASLMRDTYHEWKDDGAQRLAAALAYYTAFSLAPLLIIVIAVVGFVLDVEVVRAQIISEVQNSVSQDAAQMVDDLIGNAVEPSAGVLSTILGLIALLLGSLGVFSNLQASLDIIWDIEEIRHRSAAWGFVRDKLLSFGMVLVVGFLLFVSLIASIGLSILNTHALDLFPATEFILRILSTAISFSLTTLLFALIYKYLPHAIIQWRDVWIGALVTALLFTLGRTLLSWYLASTGTTSVYGAAGAFVIILLWVYYSAQILLFGAEFTQVFARKYGSKIVGSGFVEVENAE